MICDTNNQSDENVVYRRVKIPLLNLCGSACLFQIRYRLSDEFRPPNPHATDLLHETLLRSEFSYDAYKQKRRELLRSSAPRAVLQQEVDGDWKDLNGYMDLRRLCWQTAVHETLDALLIVAVNDLVKRFLVDFPWHMTTDKLESKDFMAQILAWIEETPEINQLAFTNYINFVMCDRKRCFVRILDDQISIVQAKGPVADMCALAHGTDIEMFFFSLKRRLFP